MRSNPYVNIDFDSIEASEKAQSIMRTKKCLRDIYIEKYNLMMSWRKKYLVNDGDVLEIGSGGGFIKDLYPEVITSDVKELSNVDMVVNAENLPFENNSIDAILAAHVIHHIPDICKFLDEANRVLKIGGGIICLEPYWSPFAKLLYKKVHPEPFDEDAKEWTLDGNNPMTSSNQAMSYILLKRDRSKFNQLYPQFKLIRLKRMSFIRYMMTGGIWLKPKAPGWAFPILKYIEVLLTPLMPLFAIHHIFILKKVS